MKQNVRLPLVERGPNYLEIIQRNARGISADHRDAWMASMAGSGPSTKPVPPPRRLIIELANTCVLDCPMCRVGRYGVNPDRFMPRALFDDIADTLFERVSEIRLNGIGEATLVPWFDHCVERVRASGAQGELITALVCDEATIDALVEAGFVLLVSWDAVTPRVYETLRRPARFEAQLAKLRHLGARARTEGRSSDMHILFTLQGANIGELAGVVDLAGEHGIPNVVVNVVKAPSGGWMARRGPDIAASFEVAAERAAARGVRLFLPSRLGGEAVERPEALPCASEGCDRPWREVVVRWNGDITVCNMFNPFTYGHWRRHGLDAAWNSPMAGAFRQMVNTERRHPYCVDCQYIDGVYDRRIRGAAE